MRESNFIPLLLKVTNWEAEKSELHMDVILMGMLLNFKKYSIRIVQLD